MPLKHRTETRLVIVLGLVMALTGFVMAALPPIPVGLIPWAVAFLLTLVYPLLLYPLFRRDRADYVFRLLHWVPAGMLLLWLLLQILVRYWPIALPVLNWYTWGWAFVPVALGILALVNYSLEVVRQRVPRVPVLLLIWVLFAFGALRGSALGLSTQRMLASVFERQPAFISSSTSSVSVASEAGVMSVRPPASSSKRLSSVAPASRARSVIAVTSEGMAASSEAEQLSFWERFFGSDDDDDAAASSTGTASRGRSMIAVTSEGAASSEAEQLSFWERIFGPDDDDDQGDNDEDDDAAATSSRSAVSLRSVSSRPSALPDSGFGWGAIAVTMSGLYCGTVHRKTKQRRKT